MPRNIDGSVRRMINQEKKRGYGRISTYRNFADAVKVCIRELVGVLNRLEMRGDFVVGYGASAKGISLMNYCGIGRNLVFMIIDDTPGKQGRYTSNGIPIKSYDKVTVKPDYILLFAWNFKEEIMKKTVDIQSRYIVPIPKVKVI